MMQSPDLKRPIAEPSYSPACDDGGSLVFTCKTRTAIYTSTRQVSCKTRTAIYTSTRQVSCKTRTAIYTSTRQVSRAELRSCVEVEVTVPGSPSLIVLMVSVDVKQR